MIPSRRIAVTLPAGPRVAATLARVREAEARGYTDAWFADAGAPDALTLAAALASETRRLRIGVAVTPVYTRTPAVLAATASTLGQLLPGRFVLGLGASSQTIIEQWHGLALTRPVARVRNTALLVRAMLNGEKSAFDRDGLRSHGYRQEAIEQPPPIFIAALRPRMIETAAEVGDGVIFNLWPAPALARMLDHVRIGAERAGKDWREIEIVNRAMVLVVPDTAADKAAARDLFRAAFAPYYATPVYNQFLIWAGFAAAAAGVSEGWAAKNRAQTAHALSDELVDQIAIIGTADECRARIRAGMAAGIHTQIIAPLAGASEPDTEATFAAFAADRFALAG